MSQKRRSLYWVLALPVVALVLAGIRLAMQGSAKLYTEPSKQFYVPDPDLGFRLDSASYHWLGLERTVGIVALAGFLLVAAFLLLRRERNKNIEMTKARLGLWLLSPLGLIVPVLAFLSGTPPDDALAEAPTTKMVKTAGFEASLPTAPSGRYIINQHDGTLAAARLKAGGESFEAKFPSGWRGYWQGDPSKLSATMSGEVFFAAGSIKTGSDLRNTHSSEYLKVEEFPEIGFRLDKLTGTAKTDNPAKVSFTGEGTITILGKEIVTPVSGTVTELDSLGKNRLKLGDAPALVVNASVTIQISETPIDAGDAFDSDEIPINVSLVMTYKGS